jgi:outer membrane protein assembly factor BamB
VPGLRSRVTAGSSTPVAEVGDLVVGYPGGLRARYRWGGSGDGPAVFALTETGGSLTDLGPLVAADADALCRAELRVDGPGGAWTIRLASRIYDEPSGLAWDTAGLVVVRYGFHVYGLHGRSGELAWSHASASPVTSLHGSSRLDHVIAVAEIETFALAADGAIVWRVGHSDVVSSAELIGGHLVLTDYTGQMVTLDPRTGATVG